jgi:hypothetical protein
MPQPTTNRLTIFHQRPLTRRFAGPGLALALALLLGGTQMPSAQAAELAGVKVDEAAQVAKQELRLNGAGIRYKVIFKVYVVALYLPERHTSTAEVLAAPGPRRIAITMLRDVGSEEFGQSFMSGIQKNSDRAERAKMIGPLTKFGELFAAIPELKTGDLLLVDWVPGTGMVISLNGRRVAEPINDAAFYNLLMKIWLGDDPVSAKLKGQLLGERSGS